MELRISHLGIIKYLLLLQVFLGRKDNQMKYIVDEKTQTKKSCKNEIEKPFFIYPNSQLQKKGIKLVQTMQKN